MIVSNKNKRRRKKEKEGRGFGRLPFFSFLLFCLFTQGSFLVVILVEIWLCFLCFEDSIIFEFLWFLFKATQVWLAYFIETLEDQRHGRYRYTNNRNFAIADRKGSSTREISTKLKVPYDHQVYSTGQPDLLEQNVIHFGIVVSYTLLLNDWLNDLKSKNAFVQWMFLFPHFAPKGLGQQQLEGKNFPQIAFDSW